LAKVYGVGSQVGGCCLIAEIHETEADKIGLILMAIAGYNPDQFLSGLEWQQVQTVKRHLNFCSHPSDATRIANLQAMVPEAKAIAAKFGMIYKNSL
jgi:predicted Zn-dependent protease